MLSKAFLRFSATSPGAALPATQLLGRGFAAQGEKGTVHPVSAPFDSQKEGQKDVDEKEGESSYARFKDVASQGGNQSKEWLQGCKEHASAYSGSADQMLEAVKRSTQETTSHAKEAARSAMHRAGAGGDVMGGMAAASHAAEALGNKLSEAGQKVKEAVVGNEEEERTLPSAQAEHEKMRRQEENAGVLKGRQEIEEAPAEQRTRDEHEILPSEFYTKH